jgi:hypothetical protein
LICPRTVLAGAALSCDVHLGVHAFDQGAQRPVLVSLKASSSVSSRAVCQWYCVVDKGALRLGLAPHQRAYLGKKNRVVSTHPEIAAANSLSG